MVPMSETSNEMPKKISRAVKALEIQALLTMGIIAGLFIAAIVAFLYEGTSVGELLTFSLMFIVIFALGLVISGILPLVAARKIRQRKGKTLAMIIALLSCLNFPGIVFGVVVLMGLFSAEANTWFIKNQSQS